MFAGLTTLRKLCNHPDLITNDYSQLVAPGNHQEGKKGGSTHHAKNSSADSATAASSSGAVNGGDEEMGEFVMVDPAQRENDEGTVVQVLLLKFYLSCHSLSMQAMVTGVALVRWWLLSLSFVFGVSRATGCYSSLRPR